MEEFRSKRSLGHVWTLFCEGSSVDKQKNNLTVFNVIDQLVIETSSKDKQLIAPVDIQIITLWKRDGTQGTANVDVEMDVLDPKGKLLNTIGYKVEMPEKIRRNRSIGSIPGMKVTESGDYKFVIRIREGKHQPFKQIAEASLDITVKRI